MRRRTARRLFHACTALLTAGSVAIFLLTACSSAEKRKLVNIIFTGVPSAEEQGKPMSAAPVTTTGDALQDVLLWTHGIYGAGQCEGCHVGSAVEHFRPFGRASSTAAGPAPQVMFDVGTKLVLPPDELCISCHTTHDVGFSDALDLVMHLPVAAGFCLACHASHQAQRQYQLFGKDNVELCVRCHSGLQQVSGHEEEADDDCLTCHNPHMGRSSSMFKAEFDELAEKYEMDEVRAQHRDVHLGREEDAQLWVHGPYGAVQCGKCHALTKTMLFPGGQTASERGALLYMGDRLVASPDHLCAGCHTTHGSEAAQALGLHMHEPVASGACTSCHHPHKSPRRYMLRGANTIELCTECHDRSTLSRVAPHRGNRDMDCLRCHNPHMGKTVSMLKSDFDESQRR
jgi:predicted CXXCH cytochrome family protein